MRVQNLEISSMVRSVVNRLVRVVSVATALSVGLFTTAVGVVRRKKSPVKKKVAPRKKAKACRGKKCSKPCGKNR